MRIIQHNDRVLLTQFCLFVFADKLADNKLQISKGVFVAICLITLMVGVVLGGVLCLLVSHNKRRNRKGSKFTFKHYFLSPSKLPRICAENIVIAFIASYD